MSTAPSAPASPPPAAAAPITAPSDPARAAPAASTTAAEAKATTDLWTRPITRWIALLSATALVIYLCWLMLAPFIDVLMWAVVLVVVFFPIHRRINARLRSPNLSAAVSCLLVIVTILLPLTLITLLLVRDAAAVADHLQNNKERLLDPHADTPVGRILTRIDTHWDIDPYLKPEYLSARVKSFSGVIAQRTLNLIGGLVGTLVQVFFVIFTMFYLFRDGPRLRTSLRDVMPLDRWAAHDVFLRTKEVIQASVYGTLVIAAIQGVLGMIAMWILGVPNALLWGVVMIVACMIPMAGAFLVWVPAALYLLATGKYWQAATLTVWGAVVIGSIDNVLRPRLVGGRTRMHDLLIFFSVLGGIQVFGVLGIVTGPAVAAIAIALFEVWKKARTPDAVAAGAAAGAAAAATPGPDVVVVTPAAGDGGQVAAAAGTPTPAVAPVAGTAGGAPTT